MGKIIINDVTVFLPDGAVDEKRLSDFIARAGKDLRILWLHDLELRETSAIFVQADRKTITHTWGLSFSGYGALISQSAQVNETSNGFRITGRVGFHGAKAMLWGENAAVNSSGALEFTVSHKGGFDLAEHLDSGVKLSFDHEFESELEAYENGFVLTTTNHVIRADMPLTLRVKLNPALKLLNVFLPENQVFESSFIGVSGNSVPLISCSDSHWTLAATAVHRYNTDSFHTRYYLTLEGCFVPRFDGADKTILPGLSGTEYFDLSPLSTPVIEFVPDSFAHFGKINIKSNRPTTAYVCYPTGTHYYSQPTDAPLFAPLDNVSGLEFLAIPLLTLDNKTPVPQMFYCETGDLPTETLESVVYEKRFDTLCKNINTSLRRNAAITRAVSPGGLMVGIQSGAWAFISLANVGTVSNEKLLHLDNIDLTLRKSFADVNMNLVFEKPEELSKYVAPNNLFSFCLQNVWTLDMNPASWNDTSLFIIKYGTDSTIRELIGGKKAFLYALNKTLDADGKTADEFTPFLKAIDDHKFTGVVALGLKLTVDENKLSAGVKTAWLGISETDRLAIRAHHLIIRHTKIVCQSGKAAQKSAFVDALVYYRADKGISIGEDYNAKDYDFRTTALVLDIKNSQLINLTTESELLINKITDSAVEKDGGNCLFLDGHADSKSGLDGFAFSLRGEGFYTIGSALESVRITAVSLAGESVFSLGGRLYFMHDKQSDLFSFGFDGEQDYGLNFSGWKIRKAANGDFIAEYSDILLLQSIPRKNSWAERFPVGIDAFCHNTASAVDKCGYVTMKTTLAQKKITAPWYGIRFRVPLGSLGDLSDNSILDMYILVAWSGGETPGLFVGARDSFISGIDVQGLIKLGFDTIALESSLDDERMCFRLSLKQFTARLLWASFPPGKNEIVIEADSTGKKLGWLGYYLEKEGKTDGD